MTISSVTCFTNEIKINLIHWHGSLAYKYWRPRHLCRCIINTTSKVFLHDINRDLDRTLGRSSTELLPVWTLILLEKDQPTTVSGCCYWTQLPWSPVMMSCASNQKSLSAPVSFQFRVHHNFELLLQFCNRNKNRNILHDYRTFEVNYEKISHKN